MKVQNDAKLKRKYKGERRERREKTQPYAFILPILERD